MSEIDLTLTADQEFIRPNLERRLLEGRAVKNNILTALTWIAAILAAIPLLSVIFMLLVRGGTRLFGADFVAVLTELPPAGFEMGGGIGPAIVGTLIMVGIAALISVPFGILAAIHLAMLDPDSKVATTARFLAKVLTGFPSILAGVFVYAVLVINFGYSALAGGVALAVLMLPTVVLAAEEAIKQVPQRMKDAAFGMGCTRTQVITKVVLPTGLPGILTGVMLAIAGAAGESAPLLFTALFSNYWLMSDGKLELMQPTASLAVLTMRRPALDGEPVLRLLLTPALIETLDTHR